MSTLRKTLLFLFFYFYISNIFIQNAYAILESGDNFLLPIMKCKHLMFQMKKLSPEMLHLVMMEKKCL